MAIFGDQFLEQSDATYANLCGHIMMITLGKTEKETSEKNFISEYTLYKRSIHVIMNISGKFMRWVLNQPFLCCPAASVDGLVFQQ